MGVILFTSVLIAGERQGEGVQAIIQRVLTRHGEQDAALSVVTLVELTHGIYRARSGSGATAGLYSGTTPRCCGNSGDSGNRRTGGTH